MPKNEDGEFELILGNKQLLSVFFIVVVLLGVFFTMGYIVGRNSPLPATEVASEKKEPKPLVVDSAAPASTPQPVKPAEAPTPAPTETAPQQPEAAKPEPRREEPARAQAESPAPKREAAADKRAGEDRPSGIYLQLAATTEREADIEVDVLRKKGFRAMAAEIPEKPGTFRVLVGPVPESGVNKMKTDLQNAGFPGDKAIRRTM
ncbi:MAG TPA: SPOR domain-containing protein [Bryobacteraceae bacterium]|nr:SPOR domain-containing protein [Bryobacteraceae bacterium]